MNYFPFVIYAKAWFLQIWGRLSQILPPRVMQGDPNLDTRDPITSEAACRGVVSCADILAFAARDSIEMVSTGTASLGTNTCTSCLSRALDCCRPEDLAMMSQQGERMVEFQKLQRHQLAYLPLRITSVNLLKPL